MQGESDSLGGVFMAAAILLLVCSAAAFTAENESSLEGSRALAQSYGARLQIELKAALADGGPVAGITVCKDRAPQIAAELSRQSGAKVSRVSRRFRNPANAAEPWQIAILEKFDSDMTEENPSPEYIGSHVDGTRYMKAIPAQPVCLVCHGTVLSDDVRAALDEAYPHDRARGYAVNDLRGAFSITWPTPEDD